MVFKGGNYFLPQHCKFFLPHLTRAFYVQMTKYPLG